MSSKSYRLESTDLRLDLEKNPVPFAVRTILVGSAPLPPNASIAGNLVWQVQGRAGSQVWSRQLVTTPGVVVPIAVGHLSGISVTLLKNPAPWVGYVTLLEHELVYSAGRQLWPQTLALGDNAVPAGATTVHIITAAITLVFRSEDAAGTIYSFSNLTTAGQTLNVRGTRVNVSAPCQVLWEIGL